MVTILHDLTEAVEKAQLYEQVKRHSEELREKVREATAELAEQNELLRRQAFQLEQASAAKSQFLANVSHELRTPLNAIIGYTHLMLEGVSGELNRPQREKLGRVDSNARHLLSIINDLLDIARIESGKMPIQLERVMLPDLIDEVMTEVEPLIAGTSLAVTRHIAPDVPEILTDRQKVKQIVLNLLSNALKFTPQGSVSIRLDYAPARGEVSPSPWRTRASASRKRTRRRSSKRSSRPTAPTPGGRAGRASACRSAGGSASILDGQIPWSASWARARPSPSSCPATRGRHEPRSEDRRPCRRSFWWSTTSPTAARSSPSTWSSAASAWPPPPTAWRPWTRRSSCCRTSS